MHPRTLARSRIAAQRIGGVKPDLPEEVVHRLGAVQAQDYLGALWAVGLRMNGARERDIEAAIARKGIVRSWPMRGTLHFVAAGDLRWMLMHLSPRVIARAAPRFRAVGLDEPVFARSRRALGNALLREKVLTRDEAMKALNRARISTEGQRGIYIVWRLAQEGLVCFGPRKGKQHTFVLLDEWLPGGVSLTRDEALATLARRYIAGHGPATSRDFAWWSGLPLGEAEHALELAQPRLRRTAAGRDACWVSDSNSSPKVHANVAVLLPAFDEYLVGYRDRSAMLDPGYAAKVNAGGGLLSPVIVMDGRVIGTWKRTLGRNRVEIRTFPLARFSGRQQRAIAAAARSYASFIGVPAVSTVEEPAKTR